MYRFFIEPTAFIGSVILQTLSRLLLSVKPTTLFLFTISKQIYQPIAHNLLRWKIPLEHIKFKIPSVSLFVPKLRLPRSRPKLQVLSFCLGTVFALVFVLLPLVVWSWFQELPNPNNVVIPVNNLPTQILDKNGRLLYEIYLDKKFEPVAYDQIPDLLKKATLAVEDKHFYDHPGIHLPSMLRAFRETLVNNSLQGGSTITQQLVKNVLLTPERTLPRKLKEAVLALLIETKFSKETILHLYLNNSPYGGNAWGVQPAAKYYFDKDVWDLNLAEMALLAGLPSSPSMYSPQSNYELAKARQKYVLDQMVAEGYISQIEADTAFSEKLTLSDRAEYIRAPHFVTYIINSLEATYGKRFVEFGGLKVTTTLDLDLQETAQGIVKTEVEKNPKLNFSNGAAVVLDAETSDILAYVGSVDFFKEGWGAYDIVTSYRQPGSAIKILTYGLAFGSGRKLTDTIKDEPVVYTFKGSKPYKPVNYDGKYHGEITLKQAFANSYNIPAVKLAKELGPDQIVTFGQTLGLRGWEVDGNYGLAITLGGREVRLIDLTNVYATFARRGTFKPVNGILAIKDSLGYEIYRKSNSEGKKVLTDKVAAMVWDTLSDNAARAPAFGTRSALVIPNHRIAVKTGTTDSKRDNWTFGYDEKFVVGVWVGNNDNTPMSPTLASGLSGAAPIWNKIMSQVLQDYASKNATKFEKVSLQL